MPFWPGKATLAAILVSALLAAPAPSAAQADGSDVVLQALALLDTPYRYGGRAPATGFDCSGLVSYVYAEATGLSLPRRSEDMSRVGVELDRADLVPGDLVFFNTLGRRYSHVGIYVGDGRFIHAPARRGRVRVERLDDYWLARYNGARRVIATEPVSRSVRTAFPGTPAAASSPVDPWGEGAVKP